MTQPALLEAVTSEQERRRRAYVRRLDVLFRDIDRFTDAQVKEAFRLLDEAHRLVTGDLALALADGERQALVQTMRAAEAAIDRVTGDLLRRMGRLVSGAAVDAVQRGADVTPDALASIGVRLNLQPDLSIAQLQGVLHLDTSLITQVSQQFRDRTRRTVQLGLLGGKSIRQMLKEIEADLRTQPDRVHGVRGTLANQAETILRTELLRASAIGQELRSQELSEQVPGLRKAWRTAGDHRVRDSHRVAGQRYAPGGDPGPIPHDQPFVVGGEKLRYPKDPRGSARSVVRCRCVRLDWYPDWFGE